MPTDKNHVSMAKGHFIGTLDHVKTLATMHKQPDGLHDSYRWLYSYGYRSVINGTVQVHGPG